MIILNNVISKHLTCNCCRPWSIRNFQKNFNKSFKLFGIFVCKTAHKLPHILKLLTKCVMKARILALALIVMMLSSPSISLADTNTIPININEMIAI